jgi:hypothetical protein
MTNSMTKSKTEPISANSCKTSKQAVSKHQARSIAGARERPRRDESIKHICYGYKARFKPVDKRYKSRDMILVHSRRRTSFPQT